MNISQYLSLKDSLVETPMIYELALQAENLSIATLPKLKT